MTDYTLFDYHERSKHRRRRAWGSRRARASEFSGQRSVGRLCGVFDEVIREHGAAAGG